MPQIFGSQFRQNVDIVCEARLTKYRTGPGASDRIANSGSFECGAQGLERIRRGHYGLL